MKGLQFNDGLVRKGTTIEHYMGDYVAPEEPTPVVEAVIEQPEPVVEAQVEEPQQMDEYEEEMPKKRFQYFSGFRGIKQKLEDWMNEGID